MTKKKGDPENPGLPSDSARLLAGLVEVGH